MNVIYGTHALKLARQGLYQKRSVIGSLEDKKLQGLIVWCIFATETIMYLK